MAEAVPAQLILASSSPFRRRMLVQAGVRFEVKPPDVDERAMADRLANQVSPPTPANIAEELAKAKATAVSCLFRAAVVIGADQVLALGERIFSKPKSLEEARGQLLALRGRSHRLHTAVALAEGGEIIWSHLETATLVMRAFSERFLDRYLAEAGAQVCRCVGAYEIEGLGAQLFESVSGDAFTIIGLPLLPLLAALRARGVIEQ